MCSVKFECIHEECQAGMSAATLKLACLREVYIVLGCGALLVNDWCPTF